MWIHLNRIFTFTAQIEIDQNTECTSALRTLNPSNMMTHDFGNIVLLYVSSETYSSPFLIGGTFISNDTIGDSESTSNFSVHFVLSAIEKSTHRHEYFFDN